MSARELSMVAAGDLKQVSDEDLFALVADDCNWKEYELRTTPVHTAQRLRKNHANTYEQCRRLLTSGVEIVVIAEAMSVGVNTLYAIIDEELGGVGEYNKSLADRMARVVNLGVARMPKLMENCKSLAEMAMATGIMFDKMQAAKGAPGLVIEHRVSVHAEAIENINALVEEAQRAIRPVEGTIVEMEEVDGAGGGEGNANMEGAGV